MMFFMIVAGDGIVAQFDLMGFDTGAGTFYEQPLRFFVYCLQDSMFHIMCCVTLSVYLMREIYVLSSCFENLIYSPFAISI